MIDFSVERLDVGSLVASGSRGDLEGDFLIFPKAFVTVSLDCRQMREHIPAPGIRRDKGKALTVVEPFNAACRHVCWFQKSGFLFAGFDRAYETDLDFPRRGNHRRQ
jgi:hypothetical protein